MIFRAVWIVYSFVKSLFSVRSVREDGCKNSRGIGPRHFVHRNDENSRLHLVITRRTQVRRGDPQNIKLVAVICISILISSFNLMAGPIDGLFDSLTEDEKYWPSGILQKPNIIDENNNNNISKNWKQACDKNWNTWLDKAKQYVLQNAPSPVVLRKNFEGWPWIASLGYLAINPLIYMENLMNDSFNWSDIQENKSIQTEFSPEEQQKYVDCYKKAVLDQVHIQMVLHIKNEKNNELKGLLKANFNKNRANTDANKDDDDNIIYAWWLILSVFT